MDTKREQFKNFLKKYEEYLVGYRKETAIVAANIFSKTEDLKNFSTREKSLNYVKTLNDNMKLNLNEERLIDVSKMLNVIYNELNRSAGYDEEIRKLLLKRKMERKLPVEFRKYN